MRETETKAETNYHGSLAKESVPNRVDKQSECKGSRHETRLIATAKKKALCKAEPIGRCTTNSARLPQTCTVQLAALASTVGSELAAVLFVVTGIQYTVPTL